MRLSTLKLNGEETACIRCAEGLLPIKRLNAKTGQNWESDMFSLICAGDVPRLNGWYRDGGKEVCESLVSECIPFDEAVYAPLYRNPAKIFGIGLNYVEHAADLSIAAPTGIPGSFFKPATSIIGPGDEVLLPEGAHVFDGEGELAVIIGKRCKNVARGDWLDVVAGFAVCCDMTALDVLEKNTRYLTISKSFDTFFGLSHQLVTPDEIEDINRLRVATVLNGEVFAENVVSNMTFTPDFLVSFHSEFMTWMPGDIISTGTPRGVHIAHGDTIEARVQGFEPLKHPVVDLKKIKKA
jgi:2-keto-4-pentenoate hydratase/2-oxohepta-3-ene-1,7-dioic acid hydratase in catechol pathway